MRRKRICLIIHSLQVGGMEKVMAVLAGYFCQKNDLEVHLVLCGITPEIFYKLPENLVIHRPKSEFKIRFRHIATIGRLLFLRRTVIEINPDSILSFGEVWNNFILLALTGLKYHVFVSDRCSPDKNLGYFQEKLRKWLYPKAKGIIIQTHKAKEIYQSRIKHSLIKVIGNPANEIASEPEVNKENIILTVGRLIPSKNHVKLIESFLKLNKPDWKLVIVGGDALKMEYSEYLKTLINELGAEKNVILAGTKSDVGKYYRNSKIFVLTSQSEGFPNVIIEAMSAGLPVVTFDCVAGPSEMITDGKDGFLVPLFDYTLIEKKLLTLMNDPALREQMGKEALKSIKRFSLDTIGEEFYSFITNLN